MKKIISLALGIAFIGLAIQPLSEASRDAYHAYLMSQPDLKRSTNARAPRVTEESVTKTKTKRYAMRQAQARFYRNTRANQQSYYLQASHETGIEVNKPSRTFTTTTRAPWKPDPSIRVSAVKPTANLVEFEYVTHRNDNFSLQMPEGYRVVEGKLHTYTYGKELEVRVAKFSENTCNLDYGFTQCAINISKNENYKAIEGAGKLSVVGAVVRQSKESDTVLDNSAIQTDTYTEQFSAYFLDGEVYTLSRYFVRNQDGSVYLVEVKVPQKSAYNYTGLNKQLFDSFRVYGAENTN